MRFSVRAMGHSVLMSVLKFLGKIVPIPKPTLFTSAGSSSDLCSAIAQMGIRKVLIVTDAVLVRIGLLDIVKEALDHNGVEYAVYDGIEPDPTYDQVESGFEVLKENDCDAVLAVGGGSSIDAAKIISALATNDKPIRKMVGWFKIRKTCLPLYVIPTTAGTGSEVTIAAVVSDPVTHEKKLVMDPKLVPMMAALDGSLMTGLPVAITTATGLDALTHAIESYLSVNASAETDRYALLAARIIMANLPRAVEDGQHLESRQSMAMAACYAGLAFTKASLGYVHAIAHQFGANYQTPHGLANAIVLPYVLDYSKVAVADRLAHLAIASGLLRDGDSDPQLADRFIEHIRSMLKAFDIPQQLDDLRKEDIPSIAKAALKEADLNYPVPRYMDRYECEKLLSKMVVGSN